jgi:hypothetical protein
MRSKYLHRESGEKISLSDREGEIWFLDQYIDHFIFFPCVQHEFFHTHLATLYEDDMFGFSSKIS